VTGRLMLIEDDPTSCEMVQTLFGREGFARRDCAQGRARHRAPRGAGFDCSFSITCRIDGFVCGRASGRRADAILLLTAPAMQWIAFGLELGADDYRPKPFEPRASCWHV